ncbi:MAG TPA: hypothetical protein H9898_00575 [Candidatus Anaerobiospirillum stercoravium]|nr:hypothetical protein [Candidatus Anaerobiospirillum stercoravium]
MLDLLQTGKYGVLTQQKLLGTTSNNITNVNTTGYIRKETLVYTSAIEWGIGETVTRRLYDKYTQREMFRDQGNVGFYNAYATGLGTVDNLLSKEDTSMATQIDNMFSSMEEAVQNTTSTAYRQELLTQLQNTIDRYNTLNYNIKNELTDINNKISDTATEINDLVEAFYEVNRSVRNLSDRAAQTEVGMQLLDKRDQIVNQLSELIDVNLTVESDGAYSLYLGNGQLLANADTYAHLNVVKDEADNTKRSINLVFEVPAHTELKMGDSNWGGTLGGYLASANEMRQAMRELGQSALALADALNVQNKGGITLEGVKGQDLFKIPQPVKGVRVNGDDDMAMQLTFNEGEGADIRSCDYRVVWMYNDNNQPQAHVYMVDADGKETEIDPNTISQTRDKDGNLVVIPVGHGITFNFGTNFTDNQLADARAEFKVQPTINAAFDLKCNITKPEDFAFASAVRVSADQAVDGNAVPTLEGVFETGPNMGVDIDLVTGKPTFKTNAPNYIRYEVDDQGNGAYVVYNQAKDGTLTRLGEADASCNGVEIFAHTDWDQPPLPNSLPDGYPGYEVSFKGTVKNGSSFKIEINEDGYNDNTNGNLMAGIKQEGIVYSTDSVRNSITEDYADMTSALGSAVMSATTDLKAAQAKCEQSQSLFSSAAGVNLDEEAANLIRYQQSYSACARIISASQTIFDALMSAI